MPKTMPCPAARPLIGHIRECPPPPTPGCKRITRCFSNWFLQFSKLVKLKKDQANLPISNFREQIVDAVRSNQVVIIAGDTGCGKSTQVMLSTI